jgi:hypothetical protein
MNIFRRNVVVKQSTPPPIVNEVTRKLNEFQNIREQTLEEKLNEEQIKDRDAIIVIQRRMADRRIQIAFLQDTPNAELMVKALARFCVSKTPDTPAAIPLQK